MKAVKMTKKDMYEPHSHKDFGYHKRKEFFPKPPIIDNYGKNSAEGKNVE